MSGKFISMARVSTRVYNFQIYTQKNYFKKTVDTLHYR